MKRYATPAIKKTQIKIIRLHYIYHTPLGLLKIKRITIPGIGQERMLLVGIVK
jgi:hypothetical protein